MVKLETLKGRKAFQRLFTEGNRLHSKKLWAVFLCGENKQRHTDKMLYAVAVPKKCSKKAVVRNRIKRLMRQSIRNWAKKKLSMPVQQICFIWKHTGIQRPGLIKLKDVAPLVDALLREASDFCRKDSKN